MSINLLGECHRIHVMVISSLTLRSLRFINHRGLPFLCDQESFVATAGNSMKRF